MTVGVCGDLNRAGDHLVFHVSQGSAVLDQQTSEGVALMPRAGIIGSMPTSGLCRLLAGSGSLEGLGLCLESA